MSRVGVFALTLCIISNIFTFMEFLRQNSAKSKQLGFVLPVGFLICSFIGAGGCPSGAGKNKSLSKKLYWLGQDYYERSTKAKSAAAKEKFLEESLVQLRKSVKNDSGNFLARNLLGYIYLQKADQELGMSEVAQCLKGENARESRANAEKLFKMAEENFAAVVSLEPKCTSSLLGLANVAMFFKQYEKAIKHARNVINTLLEGGVKTSCSSPGDKAVAWANIGWAHFHLGSKIKASKNLRQALFLAPKFYLAHYWLGRILYSEKRYEDALKEFEMTVREFGLPQAAHQYLGLARLKLGRKSEARSAFLRCVKLAPKSCTAEECRRYLAVMRRTDKGS